VRTCPRLNPVGLRGLLRLRTLEGVGLATPPSSPCTRALNPFFSSLHTRAFDLLFPERLLYSKIEDQIKVRFATSVDSFEQEGAQVRVKLTDGTTGSFDLLTC
jgi:hypothetical protein